MQILSLSLRFRVALFTVSPNNCFYTYLTNNMIQTSVMFSYLVADTMITYVEIILYIILPNSSRTSYSNSIRWNHPNNQSTDGSVVPTKQSHEHVTGSNLGWSQRLTHPASMVATARLTHTRSTMFLSLMRGTKAAAVGEGLPPSSCSRWGLNPGRNITSARYACVIVLLKPFNQSVDWWLSGLNSI